MVNGIFADKLQAAVLIMFIYPDGAFWQRHSKVVVFPVFYLDKDPYLLVRNPFAVTAPVIMLGAVIDKLFFYWDGIGAYKRYLFRLIVFDGRGPFERIEMVFEKLLFPELFCRRDSFGCCVAEHLVFVFIFVPYPVHITGNELQLGVCVGCPAPIVDGNPAGHVGLCVFVV